MKIARVQVEEGFLDGLDLRLSGGLNTIIGARGTGKTSIVELIRFGVGGASNLSLERDSTDQHARDILGMSGRVTVTLESSNGQSIVCSRSAQEDVPRKTGEFPEPLVFSQTEIENLGKSASGRLKLIDRFLPEFANDGDEEAAQTSRISSITSEISYKSINLKELEAEWNQLPELRKELREMESREASVKESSDLMNKNYEDLKSINSRISENSVVEDHLKRILEVSGRRVTGLRELEHEWSQVADPTSFHDELSPGKQLLADAIDAISVAKDKLSKADEYFRATRAAREADRLVLEDAARNLRVKIERAEAGFGEVSRNAQRLRDKIAQLDSLSALVEQEKKFIARLQQERSTRLDELTAHRSRRYDARAQVAATLNSKLAPTIKVVVANAADTERYKAELSNQLKGSGLRYGELISPLSELVEPRELVEWVERNDHNSLADALSVSLDRAVRLISALEGVDLGKIVSFDIGDTVAFYLRDGADAKPIAELSVGQRCTVVLPIVLQITDTVIVLDQPEDHIDNAFIAETLIRAIKERAGDSQLIVTTHNANIPVLGESKQVTVLDSDGRRGFVSFSHNLAEGDVIDAISSLMEGGKRAFETRAKFYKGEV